MTDAKNHRRLTWAAQTQDGQMLTDIIEILHEIGVSDKELRRVAAHYVKCRFPDVNCTLSRANLDEFTTGLMMAGQGTLIHENKKSNTVSETEEGFHDETVTGL